MAVDKLETAAKQAAYDMAEFITRDIQSNATQHGWDTESVKSTRVIYTGKKYALDVAPEVEHKVMTLEYGTEVVAPTAVIRKYANNTSKAEKLFIKSMEKQLGVNL
jgi:hypothetical protein